MKKALLTLLVAVFILSIGVGTADAGWGANFTTAKKVLLNAVSTTLTSASGDAAAKYTLGTGEDLKTDDSIVLTLGGGGVFSTTLSTVYGSYEKAGVGNPTLLAGSPGTNTATFRVRQAHAVGETLVFNTTESIFNLGSQTGDVTFTVKGVVGSLTLFNVATTIPPFAAATAMERVVITASTNIADVSEPSGAYKKFLVAGADTVTGTAAAFSYTNLSEAANSVPLGKDISIGKVVFNIAGTLTGITSVSGTGCTGSSSTGSTTGGTAAFFLIDAGKTNAYCVNTAAITPLGQVALAPVFTLDGSTAQTARAFTASASFLADTTFGAHTVLSPTAIYSITRNGSSFGTNSVGTRNTIKITDRSGGLATAGGVITITAYDANGLLLTRTATAILPLLNNATWSMTGTSLAALFTVTPMRYEFAVESGNIVVSNVKASVDGTMTATTIYTTTAGQGI